MITRQDIVERAREWQLRPVVDEPVLRGILHPYPDEIPADVLVQTYSLEELVAEKTRALFERTRPRDLYDVVYVIANDGGGIDLVHARDVFRDKCNAKQFATPTSTLIREAVAAAVEIESEWVDPDFVEPAPLSPAPARLSERLVAPGAAQLWWTTVPLESVRFAGMNRLLLRFSYSGQMRTVEPYSLRRSSRGNLLLYAREFESAHIKAFDVSKISNLSTTETTFSPRYRVEFTPFGELSMPGPVSTGFARTRKIRKYPRRQHAAGPTYVFVCPACRREFRHQTNDSTLRRHGVAAGAHYGSGRRGYLSRIE